MGEQQDQPEFRHLRRLELPQAGQPDPAVDAGGAGQKQHHHQQDEGNPHNRQREMMQHMVIDGGNDQHGHHAQQGENQLPLDVQIAVPVLIKGINIAGGIQADKSHHQQNHQQDEHRHIEAVGDRKQPEFFLLLRLLRCGLNLGAGLGHGHAHSSFFLAV